MLIGLIAIHMAHRPRGLCLSTRAYFLLLYLFPGLHVPCNMAWMDGSVILFLLDLGPSQAGLTPGLVLLILLGWYTVIGLLEMACFEIPCSYYSF